MTSRLYAAAAVSLVISLGLGLIYMTATDAIAPAGALGIVIGTFLAIIIATEYAKSEAHAYERDYRARNPRKPHRAFGLN